MKFEDFEKIAHSRRSIRDYQDKTIPKELLLRILDCARFSPNAFNLQPTHYYIVQDKALKSKLHVACMKQRQILEAPCVVVFSGDRKVIEHNLEKVLAADKEIGALSDQYESFLRRYIDMSFSKGFLGTSWIAKLIMAPIMRMFTPMPSFPCIQKRNWLTKQVMLSAMNFILAAEAAGLSTSTMEGFDEQWVRRALDIPCSHIIPVVIAVGYKKEGIQSKKSRLSLDESTHWDKW